MESIVTEGVVVLTAFSRDDYSFNEINMMPIFIGGISAGVSQAKENVCGGI